MADQQQDDVAAPVADEQNQVMAPTEKKVIKKIIRKKRRPARPQVEPDFLGSEPPPQTGTTFNIW